MHIKCTSGDFMISARIQLSENSNRIINIVKAKYDLKDKSDAINKLIEGLSDEYLDKEANEEYVKHILEITAKHYKKHPNRRMSLKELDKLSGLS